MKRSINSKITIICLLVCILFSSFSVNVFAANVSGEYSYSQYADGRTSIVGYTGNAESVTVPTELDGHTITIIGTNFLKNNSTVKTVIIPEGIKEIQTYAFNNCPNLTTIIVPSSITNFEKNAVYNCQQAEYVLPDNIIEMDDGSYKNVANVTISGEYDYDTALEIVELTNQYRQEKNVGELTVDSELMEYAMQRAAELATYWAHFRSYGANLNKAENIGAAGAQLATAKFTVDEWINSPGHEAQMVKSEHKSIGVGFFTAYGISYYIQVFGDSASTSTQTKTGIVTVTDKVIHMDPSTKYINLTINGLKNSNTLSIGDTLSPKSVILNNQGWNSASIPIKATDLTWTSSSSTVFTVDNAGNVKAVGNGTATLTAKLGDFSQDFEIIVSDVKVSGVSIDSEITVNINAEKPLTLTIEPSNASNKEVTWKSDNDSIATVENGVVKGVSKGTTNVTVTTKDGNYTATCKVTVNCNHVGKTFEAEASTCVKQGHEKYVECEICGELLSGSKAKLPLAGHTLGDLIPRVEHQYTEEDGLIDGVEEHYQCLVCGKLIAKDMKTVVNEEDLRIKASHTFGDYQSDENNHWKECGCGVIEDLGEHTGGTATCTKLAKCSVCGKEYGNLNPDNHGNAEKEVKNAKEATCKDEGYTGDIYCKECNNLIEEGKTINATGLHTGGSATCTQLAVCSVCGEEYGELNLDNHISVETLNKKDATCEEDGYTGDTYCKDCKKTIKGEIIKATGHTGGTATCSKLAVCSICGKEYGQYDENNHINTEIRDAINATFDTEGYTGDVYCLDCKKIVEKGNIIPVIPSEEETPKQETPNEEIPKNEVSEDKVSQDERPTVEEENSKEQLKSKEDILHPNTSDINIKLWISLLILSIISLVVMFKCKTKK